MTGLSSGLLTAARSQPLGHLTIETTMRYPRITEVVEREAERVFKGREGA